jgi:FKBP-type peptidyl-prolyl cis-trans isomerase
LFFLVLGGGFPLGGGDQSATGENALSDLNPFDNSVNDLITQDVVEGDGDEAVSGKVLTVHYAGALEDGTVFDSSVSRGEPFQFTLGSGQVIEGWDQGILGMKVGGQRLLIIPPELGYGSQENGPIPADSTLIFQVELLAVEGSATEESSEE